MKTLKIRPDPKRPTEAVQVHVGGRWRTARRKFSTYPCGCGGTDFEFVLTETEDRELSGAEIEARFGIRWFFFCREDVLRHCLGCGQWKCTGYGYKAPHAYEHNGWGTRGLPARLLPPIIEEEDTDAQD